MKILVIDDNAVILYIMKLALDVKKHTVYTSHKFEGIRKIEEISPNIIFLDISLAGQDGRAISKEIKRNETTKHIPIIILTGYSNARERMVEAGANDYLLKPFELIHLWKKVAKYT